MPITVDEGARQLVAAAESLKHHGLLFRGAHANLSARLDDERILMTRGGSVAGLTPDLLAVLRLDGSVVEGEMEPTMREVVAMHTGIYQARPDVGAVIHTHAAHVTAFAVANQPIPLVYEPLLRFGVTEPIPVAPWAPRGSEASVGAIVDLAAGHPGLPAVLLANHGVLVFHRDPASTAALLGTLEEAAEVALLAAALGGACPLPKEAAEEVRSRMAAFGSRR